MNENLLRFKKNQNYIFFDFETCCLNLELSRQQALAIGLHYNKQWKKK